MKELLNRYAAAVIALNEANAELALVEDAVDYVNGNRTLKTDAVPFIREGLLLIQAQATAKVNAAVTLREEIVAEAEALAK